MFVFVFFFFFLFFRSSLFLSLPFSHWPRRRGTERTPTRPWRTQWSLTKPPAGLCNKSRRSRACCSRWLCRILWTWLTSLWRPATESRQGLCTPQRQWVVQRGGRVRTRIRVRSELVSQGRGGRWPIRDQLGHGRRTARTCLWIFCWVGFGVWVRRG